MQPFEQPLNVSSMPREDGEDLRRKEAANDPIAPSLESDPLKAALEREKQNLKNYQEVIEVFESLKELAGETVLEDMDKPLPSEWEKPVELLVEKFMTIPLNERGDPKSVKRQFDALLHRRNFDQEIARYRGWAEESETKIQKEESYLEELYATPEYFHGPEDGEVTGAAPGVESPLIRKG